jgi:peptidoglycan/LPS O-acetylase OafA/YrhL
MTKLRGTDQTGAGHRGTERGYRGDIEALRGVAILLVVAYHAGLPGFTGGYIGVDVFFVLSGYLITGLLIAEIRTTGRVDFLAFYARRVRRLLPAAITVVIATLLIGRFIYPPVDHRTLANTGLATSLYVSNLYFARSATDYLADPNANPLLHTWSLAVEEQFYLFWPAIVLLGLAGLRSQLRQRRLTVTMLVLGVTSCALCIWLTGIRQPWAFFLLPTRAWEFAVGALARMVPAPARDSPGTRATAWSGTAWIGLAAVLIAGTQFSAGTVFPGAAAILPVAGTGLMLAAGAVNERAGPFRLLVNRPMLWIGRMSYSWYLWHWPVLIFARAFPPLRGTTAGIALVLLSLGLAALTHILVENPIRFHPVLRVRSGLSLGVAAALTLAGASVSMLTRVLGTQQAAAPGQAIYTEARDLPVVYADGCHLSLVATQLQRCEYGDTSAQSSIVLFGDSHAAQWFPALEVVARAQHMKLVSLTKSSCPAAAVELANEQMGRMYTECTAWRAAAIQRIISLHPVAVVISNFSGYIAVPGVRMRWTTSEQNWHAGMQQTVATLDSAGIRTLLLADTPLPGFDVLSCLARVAWNPLLYRNRCEFPRTSSSGAISHRIDSEIAAAIPSAAVVDLTNVICAAPVCHPQVDGVVRYRDSHHLSTRYAASLAALLSDRILPARAGS